MTLIHHDEEVVEVGAPPAVLFAHLDDQERLASHMEKPSMMMLGGRMFYEFDADKGRAVGSVIRMGGNFLWLKLLVEEVITVREPPRLKTWETRDAPQLVVIGAYRMGFEISPANDASALRVFIDYQRPSGVIGQALGALFAPFYARWCVSRMAKDAVRHFAPGKVDRLPRPMRS
jgi:hypothetical protein